MKRVLGLDIGGANLKMAHTDGAARTAPFALWKQPRKLPTALTELLATASPFDQVAVTMTGELCDCFETKRAGVHVILDAVEQSISPQSICIWRNDGRFVDVQAARGRPLQVASANWLALATWCGRLASSGPALLIDTGSTTTDIIPLFDGVPAPKGWTDAERLRTGELVYRGVRRTLIPWTLRPGLAAEVFATMHDAFVLLGKIPEELQDCGTADGRPATKRFAHGRLARMMGEDSETCAETATRQLAALAAANLRDELATSIGQITGQLSALPRTIIVAGSGEWFALEALQACPLITVEPALISLREHLDSELSSAACAYAVAILAAESRDEH